MWIYFGKNEIAPISSLYNIDLLLDLDYDPDPLVLSETVNVIVPAPIINNFNI